MQKIEVSKRRLAAIDSYDHGVDFQVGGKWFRKNYWHDSAEREVHNTKNPQVGYRQSRYRIEELHSHS